MGTGTGGRMMTPKFRAWEPDTKFMNDQVRVTSNRFGDGEILIEATDGFGWIEVKPEYLMQSTGLKDKNGVEIYEGDIVRHSKISTDISIVRFGEFGVPNIEEMEYQDMAVGFYFENASDLKDVEPFNMTIPLNNLYVEGIEIIGNIYENENLL